MTTFLAMSHARSGVCTRTTVCLFFAVITATLVLLTPNRLASFRPTQTQAHPMYQSPNSDTSDPVSALSPNLQTDSFSRSSSLDCSRRSLALSSSSSSSASPFTLADALNVDELELSTATPKQAPNCERLFTIACENPESILGLYAQIAGPISACARHPSVEHFRQAIRQFTVRDVRVNDRMPDMFDVIADSDDATVIQVQIDGPTGKSTIARSKLKPPSLLNPNIVRLVQARARASSILVIAPTALGNANADADTIINAVSLAARQANVRVDIVVRPLTPSGLRQSANSPVRLSNNSRYDATGQNIHDTDVAFFAHARHLVVDRGAAAAVFAMACSGAVYASEGIGSIWNNHLWRWQLVSDLRGPFVDTAWTRSWHAVARVEPNLCAIDHVARGDGEKFICSNMPHISEPSCWVLSLGCGGLFQFERHVVHEWKCSVALFDCTGSWKLPADLNQSMVFNSFCVAAPGDTRSNYKSLSQLVEIGAAALGVSAEKMPPVLVKMDVEGFEYPVLADLLTTTSRKLLPRQIVVEFHLLAPVEVGQPYEFYSNGYHKERVRLVHALSMMGNLSKAGYVTVHRADNPFDHACSELTLVRRDSLPTLPSASNATPVDDNVELLNQDHVA